MSTVQFENFLARVSKQTLEATLSEWSWLPIHQLQPVGVTLFGDVFFVDRKNRIHFLDAAFGVLEGVAESNAHFGRRLGADPEFTRSVLRIDVAMQCGSIRLAPD